MTEAADVLGDLRWWQKALILTACLGAGVFFISDLATMPEQNSPAVIAAARQYLSEFKLLAGGRTAKMWDPDGGPIVCGTMPNGTRFVLIGTDSEPKTALAVEGEQESDETKEQAMRAFDNIWQSVGC
jgi:hypothetical protein